MSESTRARRHLLGVWNPSYEADAMDAHVSLLLQFAREFRAASRSEDDVYIWWGKIRSANRQAPLPHLEQILALDSTLETETGGAPEIHLYLTDYRSLYVAHVGEITGDDVRDDTDERLHVPA